MVLESKTLWLEEEKDYNLIWKKEKRMTGY